MHDLIIVLKLLANRIFDLVLGTYMVAAKIVCGCRFRCGARVSEQVQ